MPLKPTPAELTEWEARLEAEGLAPIEKTESHKVPLQDTHGVRIPAQPVREGGLFWHKRVDMFHGQQDRKTRPRQELVCPACGKEFTGTKRARFCGRKCQHRVLVQRSRSVTANLPKKGEEPKQ
jgi:hypothetical protein